LPARLLPFSCLSGSGAFAAGLLIINIAPSRAHVNILQLNAQHLQAKAQDLPCPVFAGRSETNKPERLQCGCSGIIRRKVM
jgi:hypothetical protein